MNSNRHIGHGKAAIAYHVEWGFRREAFVWESGRPVRINFYPYATELHSWLLRQGSLGVFSKEDRQEPSAYTNPYTYHCSSLVVIAADVINDSHAIATDTKNISAMDAEIKRVRIMNEQVLCITRVCEALIKQLLYSTQVPKAYYKRASLRALLSTECRGCRSSGGQRHDISLLGSLAHRYGLCLPFERCVMEHLKLVGRRRNVEAAHSEASLLDIRTAEESRSQLKTESLELGNEFVHMLSHIKDLEHRMEQELQGIARSNLMGLAIRRPSPGDA